MNITNLSIKHNGKIHTRAFLIDESDALDGAILLKFSPQLLLCGVVADASHKQRLEGVALQFIRAD